MEKRNEMLRRVSALARENPDRVEERLRLLQRELPADLALAAPLLRALGFRDGLEIEAERRVLESLTRRAPTG